MFANTQMMGIDFAFPDVCKTTPPVPPVPIPYPNFSIGPVGCPPVPNVLFMCAPAHNMTTIMMTSFGDEPGALLGIISETDMATTRHITAAFTVLLAGIPATRLTSVGLQNTINIIGMRIAPSQVKVLLLAP